MRLSLSLPASWSVEEHDGVRTVRVPGSAVTITISALAPMPDDPAAYGQRLLRADVPAAAALRVLESRDLHTVDGWRVSAVDTIAVDAAGQVVEKKLTLFYSLRRHAAVVTVRAPSPDDVRAVGPEILQACLRARPDWSGEVVALAQVLDT